jgi:hypothetical protein
MNHSFRLLIILLFLIPSPILYSQWISTYGHAAGDNQGDEQAYSIAVGNSGDVYVTGYSDAGSRGTDICTIKYSSGGDTLWVRNFNGNGNGEDKAYALRTFMLQVIALLYRTAQIWFCLNMIRKEILSGQKLIMGAAARMIKLMP